MPMLGVSLVMVFVGVCACAIPALRVLKVHPTEALREAA
jgi:ABC-type antimicrobial peptide transport system permease subunit